MNVDTLSIDGLLVLTPRRFADHRGFFVETYSRRALADVHIEADFCQDNLSLTRTPGTIRGLHFQKPPFAQAKLVTVISGAVLDVVVDLRSGSPTFGKHEVVELRAEKGNQLWVPVGFAHGFCTTMPDTAVMYKVTAPYSPQHDAGLLWSDPALSINWPVGPEKAILSEKDSRLPRLSELPRYFE